MATIQGIYLALFGRPADPAGLTYFNGLTNNGANLAGIANLAGQPEYTARFTGMSNTQIINSIYQSLFGRDGETAGVNFWLEKLTSGALTINNIAIAILDGAQGPDKTTIDAKLAAAALFTTHLDLPAEQNAYTTTTSALIKTYLAGINTTKAATGTEIDAVIQAMLTSGGQGPDGGQNPGGGGEGPVNQPAAIDGDITGNVIEEGDIGKPELKRIMLVEDAYTGIAKGSLDAVDPDGTEGFTAATHAGTYGSLTIDANGEWTYTIDSTLDAVQKLQEKETVQDIITVRSADGTAQDITIYVHGVNDEASIGEDGRTGTITVGSDDPSPQGTATVTDVDTGENVFQSVATEDLSGKYGAFTFVAETGAWTYTLASEGAQADAAKALAGGDTKTETLTITSKDGTDSEKITVTVTGVNDAPTLSAETYSFTIAENATGEVTGEAPIAATDVDTGNSVAYSLEDTLGGLFSIDSTTGKISLVTARNYEGDDRSYDLKVMASDGSLTTSADVTVSITDANDKPVWAAGTTATVKENVNGVFATFTATDEDSHTLAYSIVGNSTLFSVNATTGALTATGVDYEMLPANNKTIDLTLRATDTAGGTTDKVVTITVTDDTADNARTLNLEPTSTINSAFTVATDKLTVDDTDVSDSWNAVGGAPQLASLLATPLSGANGQGGNFNLSASATSSNAVVEFNNDFSSAFSGTITGADLLDALRNNNGNDVRSADGITVGTQGWQGYLVAYADSNAYVFYADAGGSVIEADEIQLVGTLTNVAVGSLTAANFIAG